MHILIAPNAFKNSLSAAKAAEAIQEGLLQSNLDCTCQCFPIGDGGDGTGRLIIDTCGGKVIHADVLDPLGRKVTASFGLIDQGATAVIEMAEASGIQLLSKEEPDPFRASSFGTGELIMLALDHGVKKILITMGGSATVDGGTGILRAVGIRFLNKDGEELKMPENLNELDWADLSGLDHRILNCELVVLCDVENTLLGSEGAAAVFGPQKGASKEDVPVLDALLHNLRDVTLKLTGKDMAAVRKGGTAGGAAAGLYAFLNAKLVNGIDYYLQITGFEEALKVSDLVITGEGSIDEQTLGGKGPFGVAYRAKERNIPVIAMAGKIPLQRHGGLKEYFNALLPIANEPGTVGEAMKHTYENLKRTAEQAGNLLSL